jgi:riboflavin synthase
MPANGRFDGHIVQGHIDLTGQCTEIKNLNGSWVFNISFNRKEGATIVDKGSVCINGVSLTVVNPASDNFNVHIIPYTFENTNFKFLKLGAKVNIEFDIVGKYIAKLINPQY